MSRRQRPSADRVLAQQPVRGAAEGALRALQLHVDDTTKQIEQLKAKLSRSRTEHQQVCEERNDLLQRLAASTADRDGEAAAETEWAWYGELLGGGARFREHPPVQSIELTVRTPSHPSVRGLPPRFRFTDEWYVFTRNPGPGVQTRVPLDPLEPEGPAVGPEAVCSVATFAAGAGWNSSIVRRAMISRMISEVPAVIVPPRASR